MELTGLRNYANRIIVSHNNHKNPGYERQTR